jgi:hypothetical protein
MDTTILEEEIKKFDEKEPEKLTGMPSVTRIQEL